MSGWAASRAAYSAAMDRCRAGRLDADRPEDRPEIRNVLRALLDETPGWPDADLELAGLLRDAGRLGEAAEFYYRVVEARPFDTEALCDLADVLRTLGRRREAALLYRHAADCAPARPDIHLGLGLVLHELRRLREAAEAYRQALALDPSLSLSRFLLSAITGDPPPSAAPPEVVADLFDGYAERFDDHLQKTLGYHAPILLRKLLDRLRTEHALPGARLDGRLDVLDLGCGTGLCGPLFRDAARRLVGVDLSAGMLGKARERGVYDELRRADILGGLGPAGAPGVDGREPEAYDLVLAADVFVYIGDLAPVFAGCRQVLRPGGMFLFTTESDEVAGYAVSPHGRYVHARDYVLGLAAAHGFAVLAVEPFPLRREHGDVVDGDLFGLLA